jgi:hypothetical protein
MASGPRIEVGSPEPIMPTHGLIDTLRKLGRVKTGAEITENGIDRWVNGIRFENQTCAPSAVAPLCNVDPISTPNPEGRWVKDVIVDSGDKREVDSFIIYNAFRCSTFGPKDDNEYKERAERLLELGLEAQIERVGLFSYLPWTPLNPIANYVAVNGADTNWLSGPTQPMRTAIANLVQAHASCAEFINAVLYVSSEVAELLVADGFFVQGPDGVLRTGGRGIPVIAITNAAAMNPSPAASGFTPPTAANFAWAYIAPPPYVYLTDVLMVPDTIAEATNRSTNTVVYRAERSAVVYFEECCMFGTSVDTDRYMPA